MNGTEQYARTVPRKVTLRLIPLLVLVYILAHLDRVNVSFAKLTMNADLGFSETVFGLGAGIFFIGYLLFEVPSNMLLERIGARRLIATIMIIWGSVSASMAFITSATQFYVLRFILGIAESGLYPGIILYMTYWYREQDRAGAIGQFAMALAIAGLLGSPLSGWILEATDQMAGLAGWQWLFILEGLPTVLLAFVVLAVMTDRPQQAAWLSAAERDWLIANVSPADAHHQLEQGFWEKLFNPGIWFLALIYFSYLGSFAGIMLWAPTLIQYHHPGLGNDTIGWLVGLPYIPFAIAMVYWGRHSDRTGERHWHVISAALVGSAGFGLLIVGESLFALLTGFVVLMVGMGGGFSTYWGLVTVALPARLAAIGIAVVNSAGALGSFVSISLVGRLFDATGNYQSGMALLTAMALGASALVFWLRVNSKRSADTPMPAGG